MSLPNKLFEYMSAGLPILLGLQGEARELVIAERIGLCYSPGNPLELAAVVRTIASDDNLRSELAANAKRLFRSRYRPEILYGGYADFLEELVSLVKFRQ
jgi:glycosyltransferase involved in cell wall biosynthesis